MIEELLERLDMELGIVEGNLERITNFINDPTRYFRVNEEQRELLLIQRGILESYQKVLLARMSNLERDK